MALQVLIRGEYRVTWLNSHCRWKYIILRAGQYAEENYTENDLKTGNLHDAFYPLVRNKIRPNLNNLPNIQDATLISLVPQGAFITDSKGNTLLLKKGDEVYLGYLMDINYDNETVTFVLNKGGIIEYETLKMGKKNN